MCFILCCFLVASCVPITVAVPLATIQLWAMWVDIVLLIAVSYKDKTIRHLQVNETGATQLLWPLFKLNKLVALSCFTTAPCSMPTLLNIGAIRRCEVGLQRIHHLQDDDHHHLTNVVTLQQCWSTTQVTNVYTSKAHLVVILLYAWMKNQKNTMILGNIWVEPLVFVCYNIATISCLTLQVLVIEFSFLVGSCILILLVLGNEIVHVGFCDEEEKRARKRS